ncbi:MAG: sensor histidine kinase [Phycisphaerales bacterium]
MTHDLAAPVAPRVSRVTAEDLAALMDSFNVVTAKLQASHESLRAEVSRLTFELGQANAALERSRRLAALGEMAAGIAHEVRNPVGGIRLYARLLDQDLGDRPEQRAIALKIGEAAKNLDQIVGDVLTFAKEFRLRPERVSLASLVHRAVEACRHDGVPGWRSVRVTGVEELEEVVAHVDAHLAVQALANMVRNAFESMAQTGEPAHTLAFEAERKPMVDSRGASAAAVSLRVIDTGTGIPADVMHRVFNPFFTTRAAGTGLGLAIVHRIADAHGGRVTLRNREDARGAIAEIVFPEIIESVARQPIEPLNAGAAAAKPEIQ